MPNNMTLTRAIEGAKDGSIVRDKIWHDRLYEKGGSLFPIADRLSQQELAALRARYPAKFKEM